MPHDEINETNDVFSKLRLGPMFNFGVAIPLNRPKNTKNSTGLFVQAVALLQAYIYVGDKATIGIQAGPYLGASGLDGAANDNYGFLLGVTSRLKNYNMTLGANTYVALQPTGMNDAVHVVNGILVSFNFVRGGLNFGAFLAGEVRVSTPVRAALIGGFSMITDVSIGE